MLREVTVDRSNVQVMLFDGLLVDFCTEQGAEVIGKGLRAADFDYELQMAQMNRKLSGVDTVFLPTGAEWAYVSSSLVREIAGLGGDITPFVPAAVADRITRRLAERNREHGREVRDL